MSTATTKDLIEILNPRGAFRFGYSINPATGVETISRGFWVNDDRYQETAKFLDLYTDASTTDPGNPVETEYITTPAIGRKSTFPGKWVHSGCSQAEQVDKLIQALTRVYDITTNAELFARQVIPAYDNNILNLFGLAESEGDGVAFIVYALTKESREFCMDIPDDELMIGLAGAGWEYEGRRFEVDPETNSARLTVAGRKIANNAFDSNDADLEWYHYKTTKQEQKHQLWTRINNDDALTGLYTPDAGYNVTTVSIGEADAGSLTIHRTQLLEAFGALSIAADGETPAVDNSYDEKRTEVMDPHSLVTGTKYHVLVKNQHLKSRDTAYGAIDILIPNYQSYALIDTSENEEGNGLYTKNYKYEYTVWNTWDSVKATPTTRDFTNPDGTDTNTREGITWGWVGIQQADLAAMESEARLASNVAEWLTSTSYVTGDIVRTAGSLFICMTAHESGVFATDLAAGKWTYATIGRVTISDRHDGSLSITQAFNKAANGSEGTTSAYTTPHAITTGSKAIVETIYEGFYENDLPAGTAIGTDNVIANVKTPTGQGLFNRTVTAEVMTWIAFVSDVTLYDTQDVSNPDRYHEARTKNWENIQKSDLATAVAYLDSTADAGFYVSRLTVSDNRDGSIRLVQTTTEAVNAAVAGKVYGINSHSFKKGILTQTVTIYMDFDEADLPAGTDPTAVNDYTLNEKSGPDGNGYFGRSNIQETVVWFAFVSDVTSFTTENIINPGRDNESHSKTWNGVQNSDLATAVAFLEANADASYYVNRLTVTDNRNGSITLVQTSSKRVSGATGGKIEGINSHSLNKGLLNQTVTIYQNFDLADLPAGTDPTQANDYVLNRKQGPDGRGFYSRTNILETTTWYAWGSSFPVISYHNVGTPTERHSTVWAGVQKSDMAAAVADLVAGTGAGAPAAGYEGVSVVVRDNNNGSITLSQSTKKQTDGGVGQDGIVRTNPHELDSASTLSTVTTSTLIYMDFQEADLPAGTDPLLANDIISNLKGRQGDGLYRRVVTTQTVSTDGAWANKDQIGERNGDGQAKSQTHAATGIPLSGIRAAFAAAAADVGYVKAALSIRYAGFGKFTLTRVQQNTEDGTTEGDAVVTKLKSGDVGNSNPAIVRVWYRRTEAAKDTLLAGAASSDITYDGDTYVHDTATVTDHHDGAFTVSQTGIDTASGLTVFLDTDMAIYTSQSRTKNGVEQYRLVKSTRFTKFRLSWNDANNAMEGATSPGDNTYLTRPGSPQDMGNGLWTVTYDSVDTDDMYAFNGGDWADV